jgi:hypothetical protein
MGNVIGGVLADDVDDAGVGLLGVVQIGEPIGEARPQVQQGRSRLPQHAVVTVGCAGDDAFEQAQHTAHAWHLVEGRNEVHFRGARIGEADVHAPGKQGAHQTFRPVHATHRLYRSIVTSTWRRLPSACHCRHRPARLHFGRPYHRSRPARKKNTAVSEILLARVRRAAPGSANGRAGK